MFVTQSHLEFDKVFGTAYKEDIPIEHIEINNYRKSFNTSIQQSELYQNFRTQFNDGWAATIFANLVFVNTNNTVPYEERRTDAEIAYHVVGNDPVYFTYGWDEVKFESRDSSFLNYVVGVNIEKDFNNITLNIIGSISEINSGSQKQLGISSYYFLNSKSTIYGVTGVTWFNQKRQSGDSENRFIFNQKIGGRLHNNIWIGAELVYGDLNNATTDNGSIVYNHVDKLIFKSGMNLKLLFGKHFELNLIYQYNSFESQFVQYNGNEQDNELVTIDFNYQSQNLIGGLVWKF